jgi:hypothetical protein
MSCKALDWRCLRDVQRLSFGGASRVVDEPDRPRNITPRQSVRKGAAQLARTNHGHFAHSWNILVPGTEFRSAGFRLR